jgi:molybdopterin converting factor small subunit
MILNIKYFGRIVEITGSDEDQLECSHSISIADFKRTLLSRYYPNLNNESFQIAVNQELKSEDFIINQDCELAILPPFAGG